jgi:hypothetical protein
MPDFSSFLEKYFKASAFGPGQTYDLTISKLVLEEVGQDREQKPVAFFVEDPRGLVLSGAKYNLLAQKAGTRDADKFVGLKVRLSNDPTIRYKGKITGGVVMQVL